MATILNLFHPSHKKKEPPKIKLKMNDKSIFGDVFLSPQSLPSKNSQSFLTEVDISKSFEESLQKCQRRRKRPNKQREIQNVALKNVFVTNGTVARHVPVLCEIDSSFGSRSKISFRSLENRAVFRRERFRSECLIKEVKIDRRSSDLVDELLFQIYGRHDFQDGCFSLRTGESDYGTLTSVRSQPPENLQYGRLITKDVTELAILVVALKDRVGYAGGLLVKQLKKRDWLKSKQEKMCNVVTAHLHAFSSKSSEDTNMRFSPSPLPGDSGFNQWRDAMRMVARLPGGIPSDFRRKLWLALAEKHLQSKGVNWSQTERVCFNEWSNPDDSELGIQIVKDLHRTGCSLFCGAAGQENQALLKRVLLAYARWNKNVGYCQGFNMLAALILQVMDKSEVDSVKVMIYLIEGVLPESYFANNLRGLSVDMVVFRDLLKMRLPHLSRHLELLQNDAREGNSYEPPLTNVFTMQWFLTLFCNCLPQSTVLRVWDLIFLDGNEILLRTAIAIWERLSDRILAVNSADEFYSIMGVLTREMLEFGLMDSNTLIKSIVAIGACNELNDMRERYLYNISPWTQSVQTAARKGFRLFYSDDDEVESDNDERVAVTAAYGIGIGKRKEKLNSGAGNVIQPYAHGHPDREKLALDISALKKQYAKLRERQRQAHIILTAACARQPMGQNQSPSPIAMNHLLLGKNAIVNAHGRRLGPPRGTIPPARTKTSNQIPPEDVSLKKPVPEDRDKIRKELVRSQTQQETLLWKDAFRSGRKSSMDCYTAEDKCDIERRFAKRRSSEQKVLEWRDSNKVRNDGKKEYNFEDDESLKNDEPCFIEESDTSSTYSEEASSTSTELCDEQNKLSDLEDDKECESEVPSANVKPKDVINKSDSSACEHGDSLGKTNYKSNINDSDFSVPDKNGMFEPLDLGEKEQRVSSNIYNAEIEVNNFREEPSNLSQTSPSCKLAVKHVKSQETNSFSIDGPRESTGAKVEEMIIFDSAPNLEYFRPNEVWPVCQEELVNLNQYTDEATCQKQHADSNYFEKTLLEGNDISDSEHLDFFHEHTPKEARIELENPRGSPKSLVLSENIAREYKNSKRQICDSVFKKSSEDNEDVSSQLQSESLELFQVSESSRTSSFIEGDVFKETSASLQQIWTSEIASPDVDLVQKVFYDDPSTNKHEEELVELCSKLVLEESFTDQNMDAITSPKTGDSFLVKESFSFGSTIQNGNSTLQDVSTSDLDSSSQNLMISFDCNLTKSSSSNLNSLTPQNPATSENSSAISTPVVDSNRLEDERERMKILEDNFQKYILNLVEPKSNEVAMDDVEKPEMEEREIDKSLDKTHNGSSITEISQFSSERNDESTDLEKFSSTNSNIISEQHKEQEAKSSAEINQNDEFEITAMDKNMETSKEHSENYDIRKMESEKRRQEMEKILLENDFLIQSSPKKQQKDLNLNTTNTRKQDMVRMKMEMNEILSLNNLLLSSSPKKCLSTDTFNKSDAIQEEPITSDDFQLDEQTDSKAEGGFENIKSSPTETSLVNPCDSVLSLDKQDFVEGELTGSSFHFDKQSDRLLGESLKEVKSPLAVTTFTDPYDLGLKLEEQGFIKEEHIATDCVHSDMPTDGKVDETLLKIKSPLTVTSFTDPYDLVMNLKEDKVSAPLGPEVESCEETRSRKLDTLVDDAPVVNTDIPLLFLKENKTEKLAINFDEDSTKIVQIYTPDILEPVVQNKPEQEIDINKTDGSTGQKETDEANIVSDLDFEQFLEERVQILKQNSLEMAEEASNEQECLPGISELEVKIISDHFPDLFSLEDKRLEAGRKNSERALKIIQENSLILHRILQHSKSTENEVNIFQDVQFPAKKKLARAESFPGQDSREDREKFGGTIKKSCDVPNSVIPEAIDEEDSIEVSLVEKKHDESSSKVEQKIQHIENDIDNKPVISDRKETIQEFLARTAKELEDLERAENEENKRSEIRRSLNLDNLATNDYKLCRRSLNLEDLGKESSACTSLYQLNNEVKDNEDQRKCADNTTSLGHTQEERTSEYKKKESIQEFISRTAREIEEMELADEKYQLPREKKNETSTLEKETKRQRQNAEELGRSDDGTKKRLSESSKVKEVHTNEEQIREDYQSTNTEDFRKMDIKEFLSRTTTKELEENEQSDVALTKQGTVIKKTDNKIENPSRKPSLHSSRQADRSCLSIDLKSPVQNSPETSPNQNLSCLQFTSFKKDMPCSSKTFAPICSKEKDSSPKSSEGRSFTINLPTLSPPRRSLRSPLSPQKPFSPFPVQPTTRQPKELGIKLGLYKDLSPLKSPSKW